MEKEKPIEVQETPFPAPARKMKLDQASLVRRVQMNSEAYRSGQKAKEQKWYRVSPFYDDEVSDEFFFAGFDGVPWGQAIRGEMA